MAKDNNLTDFVTDIANTIRSKDGTSATIDPQDFSTRIVNYQAKTVNSSTSAQTVTADSGYMALSSVKVNAMATGSAKGNAGTITYKSIAQDSSNKKKFTITGTVTAPAPTVSAGYISSGTAGTSTDRTVAITLTDAQAQAAVGSASVSAYFNDSDSLSNYFNAGTSSDYNVAIAYGDTVSTAGYVSSNTRGNTKWYKIKTGSATTPATSVTANPGTPTWNSTNSNYVISVSATKSVTPTVSTGWVASGTAGTITVSGSSTLAQSTWATGTVPSGTTPTTLAKNTTYKLAAGYYPSDRYYQTQADPTLSGDAGAANVLSGKTFYASSYTKTTGTMPSNSNGVAALSMGKDSVGVWAYFPYGFYPNYNSSGKSYIYFTGTIGGTAINLLGDAGQANVLSDKTFTSNAGVKLSGTMTNNGAVSKTLDTSTTSYTVPAGYHNGSGTVSITIETKSASGSGDITPTSGKVLSKVTVGAGAATPSATYATLSSAGTSATTVSSKWFKITPTASVGTAGWISSISNGTVQNYTIQDAEFEVSGASVKTKSGKAGWVAANTTVGTISNGAVTPNIYSPNIGTYFTTGTSSDSNLVLVPQYTNTAGYIAAHSSAESGTTKYYKIKTGSATTPTESAASTSTSLSGTTLTVSRSVTPTVSTGWVSSGTAGTVTITGTVPTQTKSATPSGVSQTISPDSGKLLSSVTVNPVEVEGVSKHSYFTSNNRLVSGNSAYASSVDITGFSALSTSKTYNIIIVLGGYGWSSSGTNISSGVLTLYNVPGGTMPSSVAASKTFNASGFGGGSHSAGTFTLTAGMYNSTTLRISVSVSGLSNQYAAAAYVDVKMVIFQEV